jgi:hypothetical protein
MPLGCGRDGFSWRSFMGGNRVPCSRRAGPYKIMIERYTIKFGPAVSQKELEKALNDGKDSPQIPNLHMLRVRIELVCDYREMRIIDEFVKHIRKDVISSVE